MRLQRGLNVGQQSKIGPPILLWQYRFKILEHVEIDGARLPSVQVPRILARPAECLPVYSLHSLSVDLARSPEIEFRFRKVIADDADEANRRKETCRKRGIRSRAA